MSTRGIKTANISLCDCNTTPNNIKMICSPLVRDAQLIGCNSRPTKAAYWSAYIISIQESLKLIKEFALNQHCQPTRTHSDSSSKG